MKHVIIGSGPAGLSAAATLRQVDPAARVTILSKEAVNPYAKMALPYLLAGKIDEKAFFISPPEGVEMILGEEAVRILPGRREVETAGGKALAYDSLLVAPGASPEKPELEGGDLPFVFTVRYLPDVIRIRARLKGKTGHAVIAGAGPVGMETGDALREVGMSLTFVVGSDRVFSTMLDRPAAGRVARVLRSQGIEILTGEQIVRIDQSGEVFLKSGGSRLCDLVIFGKGVKPALACLAGSGIAVEEGIVVDDRQETSVPGIFAAGDAVQSRDVVYGRGRVNALWPVAVEQGRVAALNMAGVPASYQGSLARNILRVFGLSIFTAGAGREEKGYEVLTLEGEDFYRKIVLDKGVLKGLIFIGEVRNEGLYAGLIRTGADVSDFAGSLLQGSYGYPRHLARVTKRGR
jgi:nitrite reductase (NADH) large subunit